jgi:hypothetical protein
MNLAVLATVFGIVFVAELPDKTALASLVLGTKYRPGHVFVGVAAAFAVHVVLAIVAGSLLGLLPHRAVDGVVGVLFALGAVVMRGAERIGSGSGGSVRLRSSRACWATHMAEAPAMLQVRRRAVDQQKQALAPDPGPEPSVPRISAVQGHTVATLRRLGGEPFLALPYRMWSRP